MYDQPIDYKEKLFMRKIKSITGLEPNSKEVRITFEDGSGIKQYHINDCCEVAEVSQVDATPSKFIGAIAHDFVTKTSGGETSEGHETWTFYTLKTSKGYLDWRWYGESNGYYSEEIESEFFEK